MAWIESHQELAGHPKTKRLCRILGISRAEAIGHLHLLWWWALSYAEDGNLEPFSAADIADGADWQGDPETFYRAMVEAEFIDAADDDLRCLHDWDDYGGRYIRERDQARERQRRHREGQKRDTGATSESVTRDSRVTSEKFADNSTSTVQDRREEKRRGENTNVPSAPAALDEPKFSPKFLEFWSEWLRGVTNGHGGRAPSWLVWQRMKLDRAGPELMAGLARWKASPYWQQEDGRFVMGAERWLKERKWDDDPPPVHARAPNGRPPTILDETAALRHKLSQDAEAIETTWKPR